MHKKQLAKQFHYISPSFSDVPAVIQACLLLYLSTAIWNLIRYVTVHGHSIRIFDFYYVALFPYLYRQISHRHPYVVIYTVLYIILLFILHYFTKTEPSVSIFLNFSNLICAYH